MGQLLSFQLLGICIHYKVSGDKSQIFVNYSSVYNNWDFARVPVVNY